MVKKAGGIEVFGFEVALKTKESIWVFPQANLSYTRSEQMKGNILKILKLINNHNPKKN